jgi:phospholipid-binding lipoprotein MlaA
MRIIINRFRFRFRFPHTAISSVSRIALIAVGLSLLAGCASQGDTERNPDPFEVINRPIFAFNHLADKFLLRPVAVGYDFIMPKPARKGVSNFLDNLSYPVVIINSFLQGKLNQGASDTGRFLVNSTIGLGGIFDPATPLGMEAHEEGFGLTLGQWGVSEGPYIVVPLFGPYTVRSGVGTLVNIQVNPMDQMDNTSVRDKILILWAIDSRANLLPVESTIRAAYDPYLFVRDAYLQNRKFLLEGDSKGSGPDSLDNEFDDGFEDDF